MAHHAPRAPRTNGCPPFPRGNSEAPNLLVHVGVRGAPVFDRADFEPSRAVSTPRSVASRWFMLVHVGSPRRSFENRRGVSHQGFESLLLRQRRGKSLGTRFSKLCNPQAISMQIAWKRVETKAGAFFHAYRVRLDFSTWPRARALGWRRASRLRSRSSESGSRVRYGAIVTTTAPARRTPHPSPSGSDSV
jgi:hypothetical protein